MKKEIYFKRDKPVLLTVEECIHKCQALTHGQLIKNWSKLYEEDELIQLANIGVMKAYNKYNPIYQKPFIQFATMYIKREFDGQYVKDNRQKRDSNKICSLNIIKERNLEETEWINSIVDKNVDVENTVLNRIENEILYSSIKQLKPSHQKTLYKYYFQNKTIYEIADEDNITKQAVSYRLKVATESLRKTLSFNQKKGELI